MDHVDILSAFNYPTQDPNVVGYAWEEFLKKEGGDQVLKSFVKNKSDS